MTTRDPHELSYITTSRTRTSEPQGTIDPQSSENYKSCHRIQHEAQSTATHSLRTTQTPEIARRTVIAVSEDTKTSHAEQYLPGIRDVDTPPLSYPHSAYVPALYPTSVSPRSVRSLSSSSHAAVTARAVPSQFVRDGHTVSQLQPITEVQQNTVNWTHAYSKVSDGSTSQVVQPSTTDPLLLLYPPTIDPDSDPMLIFQRRPRPDRVGSSTHRNSLAISTISFDRFLESGCPPVYQEDLVESYGEATRRSLSLLDLREWDGLQESRGKDLRTFLKGSLRITRRWSRIVSRIGHGADDSQIDSRSSSITLVDPGRKDWKRMDAKVVERRTTLWKLVLASHYTPSFETAAKTARVFGEDVPPLDGPQTIAPVVHSNSAVRFFTVASSRRSRATPYTLVPEGRSLWSLPLQQIHVSPYAIPLALADISCEEIQVSTLLHLLNDIFGTKVVPDSALKHILEMCVLGKSWLEDENQDENLDEVDRQPDCKWDLGKLYGYLRPWWNSGYTFSEITARMKRRKQEDAAVRHVSAPKPQLPGMNAGAMLNSEIPPRRVWDLYSNRVIPFSALYTEDPRRIPDNVWAVSHSWVADQDRHGVWTRINGQEWPVSIPKDTSLDHIRIELLNMGAEYVFLDVLCLRQQWPKSEGYLEEFKRNFGLGKEQNSESVDFTESLRSREWRADVTTLGNVYRHKRYQTTIVYFNGLGRPFDVRRGVLESSYHWFNRAWTLQETVINWLPGGLTPLALRHEDSDGPRFIECMARSLDSLGVTKGVEPGYIDILNAMQSRPGFADKKPFDRVAALAYLLPTPTRPAYNEGFWESVGDAWSDVIANMTESDRLDLLIRYPHSGDQIRFGVQIHWRPSWEQSMASRLQDIPAPTIDYAQDEFLRLEMWHPQVFYCHTAYVIQRCYIASDKGRLLVPRQHARHLQMLTSEAGGYEQFDFVAFELLPQDKEFALVGIAGLQCWVVGEIVQEVPLVEVGQSAVRINKVTAGRMDDPVQREKMKQMGLGRKRLVAYYETFYTGM